VVLAEESVFVVFPVAGLGCFEDGLSRELDYFQRDIVGHGLCGIRKWEELVWGGGSVSE